MPAQRLVSPTAAGAYAGCHERTIKRRIDDGTLTGYRWGPRLLRVDLDEVDAMLAVATPRGSASRTEPEADRDLAAERLAEHVQRVVDAAPALTPEQRDRLALLLRAGGDAA
jgi:excisionase family DNA binding protein